ncbi:MAG TPA: hypothetical protein VF928_14020 [Usitatibacteraceae bacterium]
MSKPHHTHIETAFLQLSFAIKLWHFLGDHPIDKNLFDIDLTIEDPGSRVCLLADEFETYEALQLAAENNVSMAFAAASITLWEAIREHSGLASKSLDPNADHKQNLASLSYMLRCCFAHGTAMPIWSILDSKYRAKYKVGNKTIDLSHVVNGSPFSYESIGGYETLWFMKAAASEIGLL